MKSSSKLLKLISTFCCYIMILGCASINREDVVMMDDRTLCDNYLFIPSNDWEVDSLVETEVARRTWRSANEPSPLKVKSFDSCNGFANGDAASARRIAIARVQNHHRQVGAYLRGLGEVMSRAATTTTQSPPTTYVPQRATVRCTNGTVFDPKPIQEFVGQNCPLGYTRVQ
jgi:hypothetical protein